MKDLRICYIDKNNYVCFLSYDTIFEFTDYIKENPDSHLLEGHTVKATFFENPLRIKETNTIRELYEFCLDIMK